MLMKKAVIFWFYLPVSNLFMNLNTKLESLRSACPAESRSFMFNILMRIFCLMPFGPLAVGRREAVAHEFVENTKKKAKSFPSHWENTLNLFKFPSLYSLRLLIFITFFYICSHFFVLVVVNWLQRPLKVQYF